MPGVGQLPPGDTPINIALAPEKGGRGFAVPPP